LDFFGSLNDRARARVERQSDIWSETEPFAGTGIQVRSWNCARRDYALDLNSMRGIRSGCRSVHDITCRDKLRQSPDVQKIYRRARPPRLGTAATSISRFASSPGERQPLQKLALETGSQSAHRANRPSPCLEDDVKSAECASVPEHLGKSGSPVAETLLVFRSARARRVHKWLRQTVASVSCHVAQRSRERPP